MLRSFCLILGVLGVVREPRLPPRVADHLHADVVLHIDDPLGDILACGSRDREVGILHHHLLEEFVPHLTLEGLVEANIDRLDKPGAAGRDELNLHAKGLDGVDDQPHLVDPKLVQEEDGAEACLFLVSQQSTSVFTFVHVTLGTVPCLVSALST